MYSTPPDSIPFPEALPTAVVVGCGVAAGFPSPADDFAVSRLDLSAVLTPHPQATFMWRVSGVSMVEAGIFNGDILVVDRSLEARHGDVVVAQVDNDFTVKYLHLRPRFKLVPANATYPDLIPREGQTFVLVGVVTSIVRQLRP
jgi:DNA polymerase V